MRKRVIRSGYIPLRFRLTFYFMFFGIFIAYVAFIALSMGGTQKLVDHYKQRVVLPRFGSSTIGDILRNSPEELAALFQPLQLQQFFGQHISGIDLFQQNTDTESWQLVYSLPMEGAPETGFRDPGEEALVQRLERASKKQFSLHQGLFFGRQDDFSIFFAVNEEEVENPIVVRISGNRHGLLELTKNSLSELFVYSLSIIVLSFFLSQVFVKKIARPINYIAREAQFIAQGKRKGAFIVKGKDSIARLAKNLNIMNQSLEDQINRIRHQHDAMETMNRIDKAVLSSVSRRDLIKRVSDFTASLYPENGLILLLKNNQKASFDVLYEKFGNLPSDWHRNVSIPREELQPEIRSTLAESGLYRIDEDEYLHNELRAHLPEDSQWLLNIPIHMREEYYGSLLVTSDLPDGFSEEDIDIIAKLTDQIGVALQSLIQVEEKEAMLFGALRALSASIDAKSKWTAGHSERVQELSLAIGRRIGLGEEQLNRLSISALLHDIGKIGISETVLDKPGKLTDEEYALIKTHPETGAEIISHIPDYPDVKEGILYHHEAWDGSGYPQGLAGEKIPLFPRIICVADVFDAITEDRPYRKGMGREEAIQFFKDHRAKLFDPELCDVFLEMEQNGLLPRERR